MMGVAPRRRLVAATFTVVAIFAAATATGAPVSEAASFYHQGRYDSAFTRLDALKSAGGLKHRDSLSLFQYLGMASARLGRVPEAEGYFTTLLGLDSLFQFPRNEDSTVLSAFARAQHSAPPPAMPDPALSPSPSAPPSISSFPERSEHGDGKPFVLAGMTLTEPGPIGATGETGLTGRQARGNPPRIGLAMGAMPLGTGWFVRNKIKHGLVLGILQAGGLALSVYASNMQTRITGDPFRIQDMNEQDDANRWQWVQRGSLTTAVGAYIYSLIASSGD